LSPKPVHSLFDGPGSSANISPNVWVSVHLNECLFVFGVVGSKQEPPGFEENHRARVALIFGGGG
jgi:hypothetical protein